MALVRHLRPLPFPEFNPEMAEQFAVAKIVAQGKEDFPRPVQKQVDELPAFFGK